MKMLKDAWEVFLANMKNYVNFDGVMSRRDYGHFCLIYYPVALALYILMFIPGIGAIFAILYLLYALATLVPFLGTTVRRFRDAGQPWWYIFMLFIPLLGLIGYIYFMTRPSAA